MQLELASIPRHRLIDRTQEPIVCSLPALALTGRECQFFFHPLLNCKTVEPNHSRKARARAYAPARIGHPVRLEQDDFCRAGQNLNPVLI